MTRDALKTEQISLTIPKIWFDKLEMLEKVYGLTKQEIIRQWLADKLVEKD
jgi:hypothetical protein